MSRRSLSSISGTPAPIVDSPSTASGLDSTVASPVEKTTKITTTEKTTTSHVSKVVQDYTCDGFFWLFIIIAILVLILVYFIASANLPWYADLVKVSWFSYLIGFYVILVLVVLTATIGTYIAFNMATSKGKMWIFLTFVAAMIGLLLWFVIFFSQHNLTLSFYFGCAFLILAFVQIVSVWSVNMNAGFSILPYLIFIALILGGVYYVMQNNPCRMV